MSTKKGIFIACGVPALSMLLGACSLFSQTPDPDKRSSIRAALPYGASMASAESKLSGFGFACSNRHGNYLDESGVTRNTENFLYCEERPRAIGFACENRDQVTVVARNDVISGVEVTRGPSCVRP